MSKFLRRVMRSGHAGGRGDERGAILIMATVGVVLAVVASALAVDLGTLAQERRRDQKVADLAALDAARDMANMQVRAQQSAIRNGFPSGPGYTVTAIEGMKVNGQCVSAAVNAAGAGKVCVTVSSPHKNNFLPGNQTVVTKAVAGSLATAKFCMGSSLLSANLDDASNLPILNRVFGRFLAGPTGQANVLSYKGLADTNIKLRDFQAAMGVGTLNELLTMDMTMGQLLTAAATVLNNQGNTSYDVYTDVIRLRDTTNSSQTFKLGEYIKVASGMEEKALDGEFNLFQLITAGAELANKDHFIDAGGVINLPVNLGAPFNSTANFTTTLKVKVIEAPQCYIGPETDASGAIKTSQVEVILTPHIDVEFTSPLFNVLSLLIQIGSADLRLKGDFPVTYRGAGALGYLEDVRCAAPEGITVDVTSLPITTHAEAHMAIFAKAITNFITGNVKINVDVTPTDVSTTTGGPYDVVFSYPNDFTPPDPDGQTTPGAPAGVTMTPSNVNTSVGAAGITQVLGLLTGTLKLDVVESAIIGPILNPVFNAVANRLATPALKALGVAIGPVDVTADPFFFNPSTCGQPGLLQ